MNKLREHIILKTMKVIFLISVCALFSCVFAGRKCYAYLMEGGGTRDAYAVGVLNAIAKYIPKSERSYDVVGGTSFGAFNAFIMAKYPPGHEEQSAAFLTDFWSNLNDKDVSKGWTWGLVEGLFYKMGLYDFRPYKKTMQKVVSQFPEEFHKKLVVGMTEINSGSIVTVSENVLQSKWADYLWAAAATPGYFPPLVEGDRVYADGTIMMTLDVAETIERCREIVDNDEDIVLDIVLIEPMEDIYKDCSNLSGFKMLMRYLDVDSYLQSIHQLEEILQHYPKVTPRYIFYPKKDLPVKIIPVEFTTKNIKSILAQGEAEAKETIEQHVPGYFEGLVRKLKQQIE